MFKYASSSLEQIHLHCWLCSIRNSRRNVCSHEVITSCSELLSYKVKKKNPQTMLNVDFNSHVASKSEFPLPAITVIISLFVQMRMLLLVCIWGLVKKCILCPLEQGGRRGAVSYCFCVFLNCTDNFVVNFWSVLCLVFCCCCLVWVFFVEGLSAGSYFHPSISSLCPFSHRQEIVSSFSLAAVPAEKLSSSVWTCFCMDYQKKRRKKRN